MTLTTYPLDGTDYSAADAALFHCTRNTGVYSGDDFSISASGADNIVTVSPGIAWMRINRFRGEVAALKSETAVNLGLPDSTNPRIDRIILQYSANRNTTEIIVKQGVPSEAPQAPTRITSEAIYEIHLYEVYRPAGSVAVTAAHITDLRMDRSACGLMADSVTEVDTSAIYTQINALIVELREKLNAVEDGSAFLQRENGLTTLLADGPMILSPHQYGTEEPASGVEGQLFYILEE